VVRYFAFLLVWAVRATLRSRHSVVLENLALRQQLATYARGRKRPQLKPEERSFWVALSRLWTGWSSALVVVKPATVISWHRQAARSYWRWRSRRPGRPRIPRDHIALIRRISAQNPQWGEDRIAEELAVKLGVRHSTSTIRRYMVRRSTPRGRQTWKTFIQTYPMLPLSLRSSEHGAHAQQVFAVDLLTQTTAFFAVVYVFVVMEVGSRRIVAINATTSPGLEWVKQQIRQVTAWGQTPRFLVPLPVLPISLRSLEHGAHNDGIFGQYRDGRRRGEKSRRYRCQLDLWLTEVMGIRGLPIPYGVPNASPHIERFNLTLRTEALDHFIFLNVGHVLAVCREFVEYYNRARPSQALHAIPDPYPELTNPPKETGQVEARPVLGGLMHDYRRAA
jgi:putative transposase